MKIICVVSALFLCGLMWQANSSPLTNHVTNKTRQPNTSQLTNSVTSLTRAKTTRTVKNVTVPGKTRARKGRNNKQKKPKRGSSSLNATAQPVTSCPLPDNLPERLAKLNTVLNSTLYLGLEPALSTTPVPEEEPSECPERSGSWWPGNKANLKSACPWVYNTTDLGEEFYPRYVLEASCLCANCVIANAMDCEKLRHDVTVFQRVSCKNGLAVMNLVKRRITVGCHCVSGNLQRLSLNGDLSRVTEESYTPTP